MYSRQTWRRISLILLLAAISGSPVSAISADSVLLTIVPDKCISLNKGQTCYQRVQFRWQSRNQTERIKVICLWREGDNAALRCWSDEAEGTFRYNLEEETTTGFYLVAGEKQSPVIARSEVKIAWVYDNRSSARTRWRLF